MTEETKPVAARPALFRTDALAQLAVPGQTEAALRVVGRGGWITLLACLLLCCGALLWSVFGTYRVSVAGQGLLIHSGGHFVDLYAPRAGWLDLAATSGDRVTAGSVAARVRLPEEETRIADLQARLAQLAQQLAAIDSRYADRLAAEQRALQERRTSLLTAASLNAQRVADVTSVLAGRNELLAAGHTTIDRVHEARERLFTAQEALARSKADLEAASAPLLALQAQRDVEREAAERQLRDTQGQLDLARQGYGLASEIRVPETGYVALVPVTSHALVTAGQRLMTVETGSERLDALLYVSDDQAKRIQVGMDVRLNPSFAQVEEYGSLLGRVVSMSRVPQGQAEIADRLSNPELARRLAAGGVPFEVEVALAPDPRDGRFYAWTSDRGRTDITLTSGTLLRGAITVRQARPIELLIPALSRWIGA